MAPVADIPQTPVKAMNWADDIDDDGIPSTPSVPTAGGSDALPPREERDEGNGIKTIIEYELNPEGKKVKVSRAAALRVGIGQGLSERKAAR